MGEIRSFMRGEHESCVSRFVAVESAVVEGEWDRARREWGEFVRLLSHHFCQEETVLFPAIEERLGFPFGPTQVMRSEHEQMRRLLPVMEQQLDVEHSQGYLGLAESMLMLMQQHNMKEEEVLYPRADQEIDDSSMLIRQMQDCHQEPAS